MGKTSFVQDLQPARQPPGDIDALPRGQPAPMAKPFQFVLQGSWSVNAGIDPAA